MSVLEYAGVSEEQLARIDGLVDQLVAIALPLLPANDDEILETLCPTCGAPVNDPKEEPLCDDFPWC